MSGARKSLWLGAVKSAVSSACAMILSLNIVDREHFNIGTLGGWKNLVFAIAISVVVAEARYWKRWADSANGSHSESGGWPPIPKPLPPPPPVPGPQKPAQEG